MTLPLQSPALAGNCVHVYVWPLGDSLENEADHIALLSRDEVGRADRFHFAKHRASYLLAHANLRRILGRYCGHAEHELVFEADKFGKPFLVRPVTEICFNLSHTEGLCAVAVGFRLPLGIDIERIRPIEPEVARSHFSPAELRQLNLLQGEEWVRGFYRCWTSKEAILKAEGVGLNTPLDSFDVQVLPDAPPQLIGARAAAKFRRAWRLHPLAIDPQVAAVLATAEMAEVAVFAL